MTFFIALGHASAAGSSPFSTCESVFKIFTEPLLLSSPGLTGGAGRQFQTLSLLMYEQGFGDFKFGYGSAVGVTLFALIVV
ncbi:hypothetical protein ACM615_24125, partial [Rahnella sp. PAMC25617]|uniref:hypothetical protein n=1 Tax=Rahnella sp. PAMC25617 TaxID=3399684 RepID=UPI003D36494E